MSINDIMEDEENGNQVIMVHGKPKLIKDVLDGLLKRKDNKSRNFSEG